MSGPALFGSVFQLVEMSVTKLLVWPDAVHGSAAMMCVYLYVQRCALV